MPVTYEFDDCTVTLRMTGVYSPADIQRVLMHAIADPVCPEIVGMVFDVRGSQSLAGRTADEVRAMARFLGTHAAQFGRRIALVADTDASFGLMRLGAVGVEQHGVDSRVFRSAAEAYGWLKMRSPAPNASPALQPKA
jgi:hypothetical protein